MSAPHLEDASREAVVRRLKRIEGQVRGLQRMIEEDRYCGDVLNQVASVQEALRGVSKVITRNHLETCVTDAIRSGDEAAAERTYAEIMELLFRTMR
jgi:CsoR family transcriptional regulator, copper-sensing transcriptional repressor